MMDMGGSGALCWSLGGDLRMNIIISTIVGALASTVVLVAGVNAANNDHKPVSNDKLYSYSDQ